MLAVLYSKINRENFLKAIYKTERSNTINTYLLDAIAKYLEGVDEIMVKQGFEDRTPAFAKEEVMNFLYSLAVKKRLNYKNVYYRIALFNRYTSWLKKSGKLKSAITISISDEQFRDVTRVMHLEKKDAFRRVTVRKIFTLITRNPMRFSEADQFLIRKICLEKPTPKELYSYMKIPKRRLNFLLKKFTIRLFGETIKYRYLYRALRGYKVWLPIGRQKKDRLDLIREQLSKPYVEKKRGIKRPRPSKSTIIIA